jgi:4-alpha-glucanotransferase
VKIERSSGILLHISSLPGGCGIGDLGPASHWFADALVEAKQKLWCFLPLGTTGRENSPYQSRSAFAGNPLLISSEELVKRGYLRAGDLRGAPARESAYVDFSTVRQFKEKVLKKAFRGFSEDREFRQFEEKQSGWLPRFAEFMALREANRGAKWTKFDPRIKTKPETIRYHKFVQYEFYRQWRALHKYCGERGVSLMGDMPFYIEHDSADVWSHPELFDLERNGAPRTVGGVPPDYFARDGQLWGTPTYRWHELEKTGYQWWVDRLQAAMAMTDVLRLDHFRGFEAYWSVPAGQVTARTGRWVRGPGTRLFRALKKKLGELPFVAENLGIVTPEVEELRREFGMPGMAVLQFGFDDNNTHRPSNYERDLVAFTGTHDNETTMGWWHSLQRAARNGRNQAAREKAQSVRSFLQMDGSERTPEWCFIQAVHASVAALAIVPMQDVLGLGSEARMNRPGRAKGNWRWRLQRNQLGDRHLKRLGDLTAATGRAGKREG